MADRTRDRRYRTPLYPILHPVEGFQEMRYHKTGSLGISTLFVFLLFFALFAKEQLFGFAFRVDVNPEDLNLPLLFALSVGLCLLFTAINWGICTLFDGSGRLKDVWIVVGYSLAPYVACVILAAVLSQFLTSEEAIFIEALQGFGALYSGFLLIKGIEAYHEYSFRGSIVSILCTLVGILLTILLGILLFSIVQQFVAFFVTVYQELLLRTR